MKRYEEARAAVVDLIKANGYQLGQAFSMYAIGLALVPQGFTQDELVPQIEWLLREKLAEIVPGTNSLRLLKPL